MVQPRITAMANTDNIAFTIQELLRRYGRGYHQFKEAGRRITPTCLLHLIGNVFTWLHSCAPFRGHS
ncbi:unnamed protein product [Allacma fusca]|uniref:Uncharacterized protein n=1 Tax=Allacma fusca TaxID=39272 RepID=A0A8J2JUT9_9HEXA|nr:unnamed protein product [Allacma fusca]